MQLLTVDMLNLLAQYLKLERFFQTELVCEPKFPRVCRTSKS